MRKWIDAQARAWHARARLPVTHGLEAQETAGMTANDRDRAATLRDVGARARDVRAGLRDEETERSTTWQEILSGATRDRELAARDREGAAADRAQAASDRQAARADRAKALRARKESAARLAQAATDELTGARTRFLGLDEASRELIRAHRRADAALTVAFVDVDRLKRTNDSKGHLAGDALLRVVGHAMRAHMRPYDTIVRYGGDEFLCVMPGIGMSEAGTRFRKISDALAAVDLEYSISFGLARSLPAESLNDLIARADADLLDGRSRGAHR